MLETNDILKLSHKVGQSGHWFVRLSDNTVFWSDELFRLHGMSPDEKQPSVYDAAGLYHPDDRERIEALLKETLETGKPLSFEGRILRADGEVRWVQVLGEVKGTSNDGIQYLFGVFRDITDDQQQRLHNQRLAWVLENTEEIIVMTDIAGRITWANKAFEKVSGYNLAEVRGEKPGDLLQGPGTDEQTVAYMHDCLSRGEGFTCEVLNYAKSGQPYWLRISCQPEVDNEGNLSGFTAIQTDVTEEKQIRLNLEHEVEARKRLEDKLRYLATHDELSGLPNRRHFMNEAGQEVKRARRYKRELSLLVIDFDLFKPINDQHGHAIGDEVIQAFAERCQSVLRESDTPARIGGEEFAVLLPETSYKTAVETAERLRSLIGDTAIDTEAGAIELTLSIGVAAYGEERQSIEAMIQAADSRLYQAKHNGRNQVA